MSRRAYKLIEIKSEDIPTANLSHLQVLQYRLFSEEDSIVSVQKEDVLNLFKDILNGELDKEFIEPDEKDNTIQALSRILTDCDDQDYCEYNCY